MEQGFEAQAANHFLESKAADAEQLSGFGLVAAGFGEGFPDKGGFEGVDVFADIESLGEGFARAGFYDIGR